MVTPCILLQFGTRFRLDEISQETRSTAISRRDDTIRDPYLFSSKTLKFINLLTTTLPWPPLKGQFLALRVVARTVEIKVSNLDKIFWFWFLERFSCSRAASVEWRRASWLVS